MSEFELNEELEFEEKQHQETREPPKFKVILMNDDYTTFDFVIQVLVSIFHKTVSEAVSITTDVHRKGSGVCGIFTREIAETKVEMVKKAGSEAGYPLRCVMEEA